MLKRLLILSLTLILSWNGFSQTVTQQRDTGIFLTTEVARQVAIELIERDQALDELTICTEEVQKLREVISLQDSLSILRGHQVSSLENIIQLQQVQNQQNQVDYAELNKELRKQVAYKSVFATTTVISVLATIFLLAKH